MGASVAADLRKVVALTIATVVAVAFATNIAKVANIAEVAAELVEVEYQVVEVARLVEVDFAVNLIDFTFVVRVAPQPSPTSTVLSIPQSVVAWASAHTKLV